MSMEQQVKSTCKAAWFNLYQLSKIKRYLTADQLKTASIAYVLSKLDQNNCLLCGIPVLQIQKLQRIQNAAARMICGAKKYDESLPLLFKLHWLPVSFRIDFKLLLLTFKALHGEGPAYISDILLLYQPSRNLRSIDKNLLVQPKTLSKYGDRSFQVSAPRLWNNIPVNIRSATSTDSFKTRLKTFFFNQAFREYV